MATHKIVQNWASNGAVITASETQTAGAESNVDIEVPSSTANKAIQFAVEVAKIESIYILSDQALTLYTNAASGDEPANTFTLVAGVPLIWFTGMPAFKDSTPAAVTNITEIFATNPSEALAANLSIRCLYNPAA